MELVSNSNYMAESPLEAKSSSASQQTSRIYGIRRFITAFTTASPLLSPIKGSVQGPGSSEKFRSIMFKLKDC
jgi:hypothetical protein